MTEQQKHESGSNKSLLNCHKQGKQNMIEFIKTFYPNYISTGEFTRHAIETMTGVKYEDIISHRW